MIGGTNKMGRGDMPHELPHRGEDQQRRRTAPGVTAMTERDTSTHAIPKATGPVEPKPITYIGGPMNGKKVADLGQVQRQTPDGDIYKRVRMDAGDAQGRLSFDILAYWGKTWEQGAA
jgi:hypothetical protein